VTFADIDALPASTPIDVLDKGAPDVFKDTFAALTVDIEEFTSDETLNTGATRITEVFDIFAIEVFDNSNADALSDTFTDDNGASPDVAMSTEPLNDRFTV